MNLLIFRDFSIIFLYLIYIFTELFHLKVKKGILNARADMMT